MRLSLPLLAIASGAMIGSFAQDANAYSCVALTMEQSFQRADRVLAGTIVGMSYGPESNTYTFAVERAWKGWDGELPAISTIGPLSRTSPHSTGFNVSQRYLVFLYRNESTWVSGRCSGNRTLTHVPETLSEIEAMPWAGSSATKDPRYDDWYRGVGAWPSTWGPPPERYSPPRPHEEARTKEASGCAVAPNSSSPAPSAVLLVTLFAFSRRRKVVRRALNGAARASARRKEGAD